MKRQIRKNQPKAKKDFFRIICEDLLAYIESPNPDVESFFNTHPKQDSIIKAFIMMRNSEEEYKKFYKKLNKTPEYQQDKNKHIVKYYLSLLNEAWTFNEFKKNKPRHYRLSPESIEYKNNNDLKPCKDKTYYSYIHDNDNY